MWNKEQAQYNAPDHKLKHNNNVERKQNMISSFKNNTFVRMAELCVFLFCYRVKVVSTVGVLQLLSDPRFNFNATGVTHGAMTAHVTMCLSSAGY